MFTAISKPGAAGGLGTETPVCCVGITFQIPQTSGFLCTGARLNPSGDDRSRDSETRKAGEVGGAATKHNKGLTREAGGTWGDSASGSTAARRVFSE